jgi:Tol biopolymer transport system component
MEISRDGMLAGTPRSVTRGNQKSVTTAWLPGDREILFQSGFDDAVLMRVRCCGGDKPRMIGIAGEEGHHPTVSRSGDLVFNRQRLAYDIYSVPLRGDGLTAAPPAKLIASTRVDTDPKYSPDGRELIFSSNRNGPPEIWRADADGSRPAPLTHLNSLTRHGRWSPDGTKIVFESNVAGTFDLYTVPAAGGPGQRLTFDSSAEQEPSWSPDGGWIYFVSNRTGREQVFRMPADGGRAEMVVQSEVPLHEPVIWRDFLYYLAQGKSSLAVMRRSLRTGKQELVGGGLDYIDYVPSAYGVYIGTKAKNEYEFRLVREDGRVSLVLKGERPFSRPCVSPDGTRLMYSLLEEYSKTLYQAKIK